MSASTAPWIALLAGLAAVAVATVTGVRAWRAWRRTRITRAAAVALLDVHRARLEACLDELGRRTGDVAVGGEELAECIARLRGEIRHLQWLLARIPQERERLSRELFDLLLPTGAHGRRTERAGSDDA